VSGNEFKEIILVIRARPTLVAPAVAAGVVAEVPFVLTHLPFLVLSASGCMFTQETRERQETRDMREKRDKRQRDMRHERDERHKRHER